MVATKKKKIRSMAPKAAEIKYTGYEPTWQTQPGSATRVSALANAFGWYNYHYGLKDAVECVIEYLELNDQNNNIAAVKKAGEQCITLQAGWLSRMSVMGLELLDSEKNYIDRIVERAVAEYARQKQAQPQTKTAESSNKPTIQDRLREIARTAGGEIEGLFDDVVLSGRIDPKAASAMSVLQAHNVVPQQLGELIAHWERQLEEFKAVQDNKDEDLSEAYSHMGRIQMRNMIRFAEQVIADCKSFAQVKKSARKPRAKKAISPEKRTVKFRYLKQFDELNLTSVPVTKLVDATEAWLYDSKKRKLIHVLADQYAKTFTVKGSAIVGFDETKSGQKTLRKPKEQLKEFMACSVPNARKYFDNIKSTQVRFNGRGNEHLVLLKVR